MQVSEAMHSYGRGLGVRVLPVYGGQPIGRQLRALERGVDVVVATPGRALDHLNRGTLSLDAVRDRRARRGRRDARHGLRRGHRGDPRRPRRTRARPCCSRPRCRRGSTRSPAGTCSDPVRIEIGRADVGAGDGAAGAPDRLRRPARAQAGRARPRAGRRGAHRRARVLPHARRGRPAHRDAQRPRLPRRGAARRHDPGAARPGDGPAARAATPTCCVATDVAARGLDIDSSPTSSTTTCRRRPESYVHRIGRVGRAGREGVAITLAEPREHRMLKTIERVTKQRITVEKVPTVADLRARRLELTRAGAARESLLEDDLGPLPRGRRDAGRRVRPDGRRRWPRSSSPTRPAASAATRRRSPRSPRRRRTRPARRARPTPRRRAPHANGPTAALRRRRPHRRHPPAGPRRRHHQRGRPAAAATSARSRSPTASRSSRCPSAPPTQVIGALRGTTIKGKKATIRRERFTQPRR